MQLQTGIGRVWAPSKVRHKFSIEVGCLQPSRREIVQVLRYKSACFLTADTLL
jgi:hypothetical protein